MDSSPDSITQILRELQLGDNRAAERLLPHVYDELHRLAEGYMRRERAGHTLQPTALVHEAYVRLINAREQSYESRAQFMGVAARAMRQVLVDHARKHAAGKRGGDRLRVTLDEPADVDAAGGAAELDLLALDEALCALGAKHERVARVVELRFFGGLKIREAAAVLGVSHKTVEEDWSLARAWLGRALSEDHRQ